MKKLLFSFLVILFSFQASASVQGDVKQVLKSLFPFLSKNGKSAIQTHKCNIDKQKWSMLLLTQQPFKQDFKFKKGCDLDGSFTVKMNEAFPINLKIRKLKNYKNIKTNGKIELKFTDDAILSVALKDSTLKGKKSVAFDMDYAVVIDVTSKDIIKKHKGGTLHIKELDGKKINKKIKLNKNLLESSALISTTF